MVKSALYMSSSWFGGTVHMKSKIIYSIYQLNLGQFKLIQLNEVNFMLILSSFESVNLNIYDFECVQS